MLKYKNVYFVGIKGVAMTHLARICAQKAMNVRGSDVSTHFITDHLLSGIQIDHDPHTATLPSNTDLLVYSAAHGGVENEQVKDAYRKKICVMHQAELLNHILSEYRISIGVAGCHGKTTTTSLIAYALIQLGVKPGYLAGVSEFCGIPAGDRGQNNYFVAEADEYGMSPPTDTRSKLDFLHPTHRIVTNIAFDHPDVFKDINETIRVFETFLKTSDDSRPPVVCIDDSNICTILERMNGKKYITYGTREDAIYQLKEHVSNTQGTICTIIHNGISYQYNTKLFGNMNALNTTAAVACLHRCGFSPDQIAHAIKDFTGAKRRLEFIAQVGNSVILDDYAHHPDEISATIRAARDRFPSSRIIVVFQPHTFSRTDVLASSFVEALAKSEHAFVFPVFTSARETSFSQSAHQDLVFLAHLKKIQTIHSLTPDTLDDMRHVIQKGDVIITMGAGDVYTYAPCIRTILESL